MVAGRSCPAQLLLVRAQGVPTQPRLQQGHGRPQRGHPLHPVVQRTPDWARSHPQLLRTLVLRPARCDAVRARGVERRRRAGASLGHRHFPERLCARQGARRADCAGGVRRQGGRRVGRELAECAAPCLRASDGANVVPAGVRRTVRRPPRDGRLDAAPLRRLRVERGGGDWRGGLRAVGRVAPAPHPVADAGACRAESGGARPRGQAAAGSVGVRPQAVPRARRPEREPARAVGRRGDRNPRRRALHAANRRCASRAARSGCAPER
jgi:hypothetical protein